MLADAVPELLPVRDFVQRFSPAVTEGRVRWQLFNSEQNGLADSGAIVRVPNAKGEIGPRSPVLINPSGYFSWLLGQQRRRAA
jgi:hypothetical protein